jgi:hypothetical protein
MVITNNTSKITPITVEKYLKGIDFPANREELAEQAKQNNAPSEIVGMLNKLEEKQYNNVTDIAKEVSRVEKG